MKKYVILAHLPLFILFLCIYLAKTSSWLTFFIVSNIIPDYERLFSLLTEATQMTQNKKKKLNLGVRGGMKFK
jgi:hypothetical protein